MALTATPYGLKPVGVLSNRSYNAGIRQVKIASGLATNIFRGDLVKILSSGTIDKETGTTSTTANALLGVFMGVEYTDPNLNYLVHRNFWPTGTVAADAYAYVYDDPFGVFQVQADAALAQTNIGNNIALVQNAGSTVNGMSRVALSASSAATTNTLPLKIVGFADNTTISDTYPDVLVTYNAGMHHYLSATGI